MKRILMILTLSFGAVFAWGQTAKVLLVSDIDDTIKVSHVLSTIGKFGRAADVTTPFLGMAALYQLIINENPANTKIVYLSNAPDEVAGIPALRISHQTFLDRNHFPKGSLLLRDGLFEQDHKIKELRLLIESEKPDVLILLGDNGEKDILIYDQIVSEYAGLTRMKILTFIHQLYATEKSFLVPDFLSEIGLKIKPQQVGFVTPVEIGLKLNEQHLLSRKSLEWMYKNIIPRIVSESSSLWDGFEPISFPSFKKCQDFRWIFATPAPVLSLVHKIERECN